MKAKRRYTYEPDYVIAPGETLKEVIESLCLTQKELALHTGLTEQTIIRIFSGEQPISDNTLSLSSMKRINILKGKKKQLYIADGSNTSQEEVKAAAFATTMLIPI